MQKIVKVIIGTPQWSLNGVNVFCANLARGLTMVGWPVHILVTQGDAVDLKPLPLDNDLPLQFLPVYKQMSWRKRWQLLQAHLVAAAPCIYLPNHDRWHACISPTLPDHVAVVGVVHSDEAAHYEQVKRLGTYWQQIVAVTPTIQHTIAHKMPMLVDKLTTISYGVPIPSVPLITHSAETIRIIYAGRLDKQQKRVELLPQIAAALRAKAIPFQMTIVGNGEAAAELHTAFADFADVQMLDTVAPAQVRVLYAQHDIFLLPSAYEGLPIALLDAMAQGCVPVVSRVRSGVADVVQHEANGLLVTIGDVAQFATEIIRLQRQPTWCRQLGQRAFETVRDRFSLGQMVQAYVKLFEAVSAEITNGQPLHVQSGILPPPEFTWKHRLPYHLRHYAVTVKQKLQGKLK